MDSERTSTLEAGRVPVVECQRRLAGVWAIGSALALALFLAQTWGGKYGDQTAKAWGWFVPTLLPTFSLIVGVIAGQARQVEDSTVTASSLAFRLSFWLSVAYLALVMATPLMEPMVNEGDPLDFFNLSTLWLGPLQTLAGIALGAFFVSRQEGKKDEIIPQ